LLFDKLFTGAPDVTRKDEVREDPLGASLVV
ncbi:MAG: hypothetical protein JWO86_7727, partial [Myxococcaceae bacterium]|nr:hypothetical protein [Myxococcaceae bacterium]